MCGSVARRHRTDENDRLPAQRTGTLIFGAGDVAALVGMLYAQEFAGGVGAFRACSAVGGFLGVAIFVLNISSGLTRQRSSCGWQKQT
jgi:hypothetical protein